MTYGAEVTFCGSDHQQAPVSGTWYYSLETGKHKPLCSGRQATTTNTANVFSCIRVLASKVSTDP